MTLTEPERRAIEALRAKQERWPRLRWALMFCGLLSVGLGVALRLQFERTLMECSRSLSLTQAVTGGELYFASQAAVMFSLGHLFLWFGIGIVVFVVVRWRGNPSHIILIRLARELELSRGSAEAKGNGASAV